MCINSALSLFLCVASVFNLGKKRIIQEYKKILKIFKIQVRMVFCLLLIIAVKATREISTFYKTLISPFQCKTMQN